MRNDSFVKKVYNSTLDLHDLGQTNWCATIKAIVYETQLYQIWENQSIDNRQLATRKESLHKSYMAECIRSIHDSIIFPKLRTL